MSLARHLQAPAQRVLDLGREIARRPPAEHVLRLADVADQSWRIARPPGADLVRYRSATDARGFGDCLAHAEARAAAEVERLVQARCRLLPQPVQRPYMGVREVADMDEVAHARA